MIKIKGIVGGRTTLVFGLSHANLDRLREQGLRGRIAINGDELGVPGLDILITAAEDERTMFEAFKDGIGEGTQLRLSPRLKLTS